MEMIQLAWRYRSLIGRLARRDIVGRYKGSVLGLFWSFFNPLVMLAVYSFVFGMVFKARWGAEVTHNFAIILFTGLICHSLLAECLMRAPTLVVNNANYVKKVVFPLETLGWITLISALFHFAVSLTILLLAQLTISNHVPWTWVFTPLVVAPLVLVCLGVTWALSSLGVFLRDVSQVTTILSTMFLFLCPIFYPMHVIPEQYQIFIYLNPLTFIVDQMQQIIIREKTPNFVGIGVYLVFAFIFAQASYLWFVKTKKGFADVL